MCNPTTKLDFFQLCSKGFRNRIKALTQDSAMRESLANKRFKVGNPETNAGMDEWHKVSKGKI